MSTGISGGESEPDSGLFGCMGDDVSSRKGKITRE
jgi:hypothetical protein